MAPNSQYSQWQIGCRGGPGRNFLFVRLFDDAGWRADIFFRHSSEFPDNRGRQRNDCVLFNWRGAKLL